jgi:hypothetical protein
MGLGRHPAPAVSVWKPSFPNRALQFEADPSLLISHRPKGSGLAMLSVEDGSVFAPTASMFKMADDLVNLVGSKHVQDAQTLEASGLMGN